uniref:Uncharacterized protein n=1 Tax=Globodera rostochiensis TaxID=31243 RepID=A0A914GT93_GLORO
MINPPEQRRKKKQLPTMCAPRRLSVNSIHRARTIVLNKSNPRSRVISRQRAVPVQQQQQSLALPTKIKERLNFDGDHQHVQQQQQPSSSEGGGVGQLQQGVENRMLMDQVHHQQQKQAVDGGGVQQQQQQLDETVMDQVHHQQQKQAVDGGGVQQQQHHLQQDVDDEINVTTCTTTGAFEIVEENTPYPTVTAVRPPRRAAAETAAQRFEQQVKPKRQRAVQQQQQSASSSVAAPPTPPTANVADIEEAMGEQLKSAKSSTTDANGKKKLANREHDTSFKVRIVTPVPQVVQQQKQKRRKEVDEEEEEFEIKALLALFVHSDGERAYYVDWKIARGQECWVIAPDMVACIDAATRLTELTTVSGTLAAILGHDTPHHLLCILEQDAQYHEALVGTNAPARTARDIMFSKDATQRQRTKAIGQLDQFVVDCMSEEAIALYKEKERKKEEKKKQQQQQMNGVEKRK